MSGSTRAGLLLIGASAAAVIVANSPFAPLYHSLLATRLGPLDILHWINDGLMTAFFFLVGLEVKRAMVLGELRHRGARVLPLAAASAGMIVPALVYVLIAGGSPGAARGWAIPAATDIAFAQAMLAFAGPGIPASLRLFLTTAAIIDDIGAVAIIAVAYSHGLDPAMLAVAAAILVALTWCARSNVMRRWPYVALTLLLWAATLQSGVHPTVAGVLGAMAVPVIGTGRRAAPAGVLDDRLAPWVAGLIVPLFGFANAGLDLRGLSPGQLVAPMPLAILLGLALGKPLGFLAGISAAIRFAGAPRPRGATIAQLCGIALLAGIGFTMSLFIGGLAFAPELMNEVRLGVLGGSAISALAGLTILRLATRTVRRADGAE